MKAKIMRGWVFVPKEERGSFARDAWECACGCGCVLDVHPDDLAPGFWDQIHALWSEA